MLAIPEINEKFQPKRTFASWQIFIELTSHVERGIWKLKSKGKRSSGKNIPSKKIRPLDLQKDKN